uniref:uncharacterized protein n=1 Tax=Pristiophorus japonicus TaxID=55135 RepID=UPI00398E71EC
MASQETPHNVSLLSDYFNFTHSPSDNNNSTHTPSASDNSIFIETIRAQQLISRCVYGYSVFGLAGLLTGIYILAIYIGNYRRKRKFETLDVILFSLTVADLTLVLFSLTDIVRPEVVETTALGCAVLSFFFNVPYFYTEYIHVAISISLACDHVALARKALSRPHVSIAAAAGLSVLFSIVVAALTGAGRDPGKAVDCHVDPLGAPREYGAVKFTLGFLMPTLLLLSSVLLFLVRYTCRCDLQGCRERVHPHRAFLALATVTFACRLVYNVLLLLRPRAGEGDHGAHIRRQTMATIGELVMFAGSCLCLVSVAVFHEMKRDAAMETLRCITEPCRLLSTNRNHIAMNPNIEIKEQPEERASLD